MIQIPILIGVAIVAALTASACSSKDDGGNGNGTGDVDTDGNDTDSVTDTGTEDIPDGGDTETETEDPNPCDDRPGINGSYYKCMRGSEPCSVLDIDMYGSTMRFVSDSNHLARINVDDEDTLGFGYEVSANFNNNYFAGNTFNTSEGLKPLTSVQSDQLSEIDGLYSLYFMYEGTIYPDTLDEDTAMLSGVAFFDGETNPMDDPEMIQGMSHMVSPYDMYFSGVSSAVLFTDGADQRIGLAATEPASELGVFLAYGFNTVQWMQQSDIDFPVLTSGNNPCATALLSDTETEKRIAVVNPEGGAESWQAAGASIDIIDPTVSAAATSETSALSAKVGLITFGDGVTLKPFNELPITVIEDVQYGIVVGGAAGDHRTLYVVNFDTNTIAGSLDLSDLADSINGIALKGTTVALTVSSEEHRDGTNALITIDITDPSAPVVDKQILDLGWGLKPVDIHEASGTVYLAAQASFCEEEPAEDAPYSTMIAVDPVEATSY